MTKIVLVGCGRQGIRHLTCLAKLRRAFDIRIAGIVDGDTDRMAQGGNLLPQLGFTGPVRCGRTLETLTRQLDLSDVVVDVVTSNNTHHTVASTAASRGAQGIIVEKPMADTLEHARCITNLDVPVYVAENYLFSRVTRFARRYLRDNDLQPYQAMTEFSKDRLLDSSHGRGMLDGYTPHVFTIEIPHQIAISSQLLGYPLSVHDAWCADMILPGRVIADHGQGAITLHHGGSGMSYNFSCLQGDRRTRATLRTATVDCRGGTKVLCRYPTSADLIGSMHVYRHEKLLHEWVFVDDSLTETLRFILARCQDRRVAPNDPHFGFTVMDVIEAGQRLARQRCAKTPISAEESRVSRAMRSTSIGM